MRQWLTGFVRAEIGRFAGEIVVDSAQPHACVDRDRAGTKLEVEIRRLVERAWIGAGRRDLYKDIVVDEHAVRVVPVASLNSFSVLKRRRSRDEASSFVCS